MDYNGIADIELANSEKLVLLAASIVLKRLDAENKANMLWEHDNNYQTLGEVSELLSFLANSSSPC